MTGAKRAGWLPSAVRPHRPRGARLRHSGPAPGHSAWPSSAAGGEPQTQPSLPAIGVRWPAPGTRPPQRLAGQATAVGKEPEVAGSRWCQVLAWAALARADHRSGSCPPWSARPRRRLAAESMGAGNRAGFALALTRRCRALGVVTRQTACPAVAGGRPLPCCDPQARKHPAQDNSATQHDPLFNRNRLLGGGPRGILRRLSGLAPGRGLFLRTSRAVQGADLRGPQPR